MTNYRLRRSVQWVVDRYTVTVSDGQGSTRTLHYPEAAVWDLFTRGYAFPKVVTLVSQIASIESAESEQVVRSSIAHWADAGFLETA